MTITKEIKSQIRDVLDTSYQLLEAGLISKGLDVVMNNLNDLTKNLSTKLISSEIREECFQHPIAKLLLQEPMTKWSFQKPRGYSGDAELIDYMYRLKSCRIDDTYIGRELYGILSCAGSVAAVRWRANHMAESIDNIQRKLGRKIDLISVASGHLRELGYIKNAEEKINRFVCIDQDAQSNEELKRTYNKYSFLEVIDSSITYIVKNKLADQKFDFIYSSGLFDYLNDKVATKMIERLYGNLREGGEMIIPNFLKGISEKAYMETFMKWNLIYRNDEDMLALIADLDIPRSNQEIYHDEMGKVVYLKITK